MISIVSFLLCFACEEISFWIFDFLMNELCLNEFYQENTNIIEQEILVIKNLGKVFKIFIEEDENLINNFLSTHINVCFKTGFLNVLNFQTVYFIWDNMLSKGSVIFNSYYII